MQSPGSAQRDRIRITQATPRSEHAKPGGARSASTYYIVD
jgi:hypothetical protein